MLKERFKHKYPFTCCVCGAKDLWAKPSMSMVFGRNSGHGTCPQCKTFLHLVIYPDLNGEYMVSKKWSDYIKEGIKS